MYNNIPDSDFNEIVNSLGVLNHRFSGETILILGNRGFLGTAFTIYFLYLNKHVLEKPCKIIGVDNFVAGNSPFLVEADNLVNFTHDLTTPLGMKLCKENVGYILNCSGIASPKIYSRLPLATMDIATLGTRNILELATTIGARLLNFSSSEVLGTPDEKFIPTPEEAPIQVMSTDIRSCYDVTKVFIETASHVFKKEYNTDVIVVRPFNCIGMSAKNDYRVIPTFMNKALKGEKLQVFAPGTQTRTFVYYTDFLSGCLKALLNGKELIYHIGNDQNEIGMLDLARMVSDIARKPEIVELVATPETFLNEPKRRCPDISKAKQQLGYKPKVGIREALQRIYDWTMKTQ